MEYLFPPDDQLFRSAASAQSAMAELHKALQALSGADGGSPSGLAAHARNCARQSGLLIGCHSRDRSFFASY